MDKLNKNELIEIVAEKAFLSKRDAREALDVAFDEIQKALLDNREVNITNFGSFVPITRQARIGTDPKTHQKIQLKEKKSVAFRACKTFKEKL